MNPNRMLALTLLLACGSSPNPADGGSRVIDDAGRPDAGPTTDAGERDAGERDAGNPIVAPADSWTWVDFPESRCANGTSTGIGVRLHPGSTRLLVYLQGGGSCDKAKDCWGENPGAQNTNGYGAAEFAKETILAQNVQFRPDPANPFHDANQVFVAYCSGDSHSGRATVDFVRADGTSAKTYFHGADNLELYLARLVATFPNVTRVYFSGSSAGGSGVMFNFHAVKTAFAPRRVDAIVDSAPAFSTPDGGPDRKSSNRLALWQTRLPPDCTNCLNPMSLFDFNRSVQPDGRWAFISHRYDDVAARATGYSLADFALAIDQYVPTIGQTPNTASFIVKNAASDPEHVVLGKPDEAMLSAAMEFLTKFANDQPSWATTFYP